MRIKFIVIVSRLKKTKKLFDKLENNRTILTYLNVIPWYLIFPVCKVLQLLQMVGIKHNVLPTATTNTFKEFKFVAN